MNETERTDDTSENRSEKAPRPRIGLEVPVDHAQFGRGRVLAYEGERYVVVFPGGEVRKVAFGFEGMTPAAEAGGDAGDPELDRLKQAVREVLGETGWLDAERELGSRWRGGTLRLVPGKEGAQPKDVPLETFFGKVIGIREKLRVLEQKINNHPSLADEEKLELEGYVTRCYGSLTTFNALFATKESHLRGQGKSG